MQLIFRSKVEVDFTVLKNDCIRDKNLTWEARGVLHYLLSMPGDWEVNMRDLMAQSPSAKEHTMGRIMKELEREGYIIRKKRRNQHGHWCWITLVFDTPQEDLMNPERQAEIKAEMDAILGPEVLERTKKIKEQNSSKVDPDKLKASAIGIGENDPLEGFPVHVKETLASFVKVSEIAPTKRKKSDWIDTGNEWREMGVKPADVEEMYKYALENGWTISRPGSITSAYHAMRIDHKSQQKKGDKQFRIAE